MLVSVGHSVATIDEIDDKEVNKFIWSTLITSSGNIYARAYSPSRIPILMHRLILEKLGFNLQGLDVDHEDRNTLNNVRSNLRIATRSQNMLNTGVNTNNTSGYKGVSFDKRRNKFRAYIKFEGIQQYLGQFDKDVSAAIAYNHHARMLYGEYAGLNKIE